MRSIRLSLTVYFLGLLALGLGAASLLAYHTAYQSVMAKQATLEELVHAQYRERCEKEERRLDEQLRLQAQYLFQKIDFHLNWEKFRLQQLRLGSVLGASVVPGWFPVAKNLPELVIPAREGDLFTQLEMAPPQYFQV